MSEGQGEHPWQTLRESVGRSLLAALVSLGVFVGALYALTQLDTWAFGNRPDRSGDFFLYFCVSALLAIISARMVAWLARPNKSDGIGLFAGQAGRLAGCATISVCIIVVWIIAIVVATKF
jgi:hypothetical protein